MQLRSFFVGDRPRTVVRIDGCRINLPGIPTEPTVKGIMELAERLNEQECRVRLPFDGTPHSRVSCLMPCRVIAECLKEV